LYPEFSARAGFVVGKPLMHTQDTKLSSVLATTALAKRLVETEKGFDFKCTSDPLPCRICMHVSAILA